MELRIEYSEFFFFFFLQKKRDVILFLGICPVRVNQQPRVRHHLSSGERQEKIIVRDREESQVEAPKNNCKT